MKKNKRKRSKFIFVLMCMLLYIYIKMDLYQRKNTLPKCDTPPCPRGFQYLKKTSKRKKSLVMFIFHFKTIWCSIGSLWVSLGIYGVKRRTALCGLLFDCGECPGKPHLCGGFQHIPYV